MQSSKKITSLLNDYKLSSNSSLKDCKKQRFESVKNIHRSKLINQIEINSDIYEAEIKQFLGFDEKNIYKTKNKLLFQDINRKSRNNPWEDKLKRIEEEEKAIEKYIVEINAEARKKITKHLKQQNLANVSCDQKGTLIRKHEIFKKHCILH